MKRRIVLMLSLLCMCTAIAPHALAAVLRYNNDFEIYPSFSINGNTAYCSLIVDSDDAESSITAVVTLLKDDNNGGQDVLYRWIESGKKSLGFSEQYTSERITSGTYQMEYSVVVDGSGGIDNISDYVEVTV